MPSKGNIKRPHGTGTVRPKRRRWEGRFSYGGEQIPVSLGVRKEVDPVNGISEAEAFRKLQKVISALRRKLADKTVRNIMSTLFSICDHGVKKTKVLPANECIEVEKLKARSTKTEMIVLSTAELDEIRAAFPDTPLGRQDALMVLVAARSGLRQGELISIRWRNIDFMLDDPDGGIIRVATSFEWSSTKRSGVTASATRRTGR